MVSQGRSLSEAAGGTGVVWPGLRLDAEAGSENPGSSVFPCLPVWVREVREVRG